MVRKHSNLCLMIESALERKFKIHSSSKAYRATFKTPNNTVFLVERGTVKHVNLWIPDQEQAKHAAEDGGLKVEKTVPYPKGPGENYGRLSSLKAVKEIGMEVLLKVRVTTVEEAMLVADNLR